MRRHWGHACLRIIIYIYDMTYKVRGCHHFLFRQRWMTNINHVRLNPPAWFLVLQPGSRWCPFVQSKYCSGMDAPLRLLWLKTCRQTRAVLWIEHLSGFSAFFWSLVATWDPIRSRAIATDRSRVWLNSTSEQTTHHNVRNVPHLA